MKFGLAILQDLWAACVMADEKVEKYMFEKGLY